MKKTTLYFLISMVIMMIPAISKAQMTNLVFFTEQGERFSVVLNGVLQNDKPETNIKITDLPAPTYKLKILFADANIPELDKTLMYQQGTETTFNIKKNNKGQYVLRFLSAVNMEDILPPPPTQKIIVYTTVAPTTTVINQTNVTNTTINNNTNVSSEGNVSINMNMGGVSTNVSSSTSSMSTNSTSSPNEGEINVKDHYILPGYNGPIGCPYPISDLDFADVKRSIESKSFEDSKLTIAKEVTSANCLFAREVKEIMLLFSFEATRLTFAKFPYKYTFDKGNYYKVNDAFEFESSIDDLNRFTKGG
ncbi:MAG: DUF4476 domain-containing protein, partial [Bacteroidota bacterium]